LNHAAAQSAFARYQAEVVIPKPASHNGPNRPFDLGIIELQSTQLANLKEAGAL
jgi:hypothetical protein